MTCGIYQITNTITGKSYFGSSVHIERRFGQHRRRLEAGTHHSRHLQRSWALDGGDAFEFKIVLVCSADNLLIYEQAVITGYKAYMGEFGYNVSPTAGNTRGRRHTDETKEKLRQANLGKTMDPEHRRKFLEAAARPKSAEHRRNIGEAQKATRWAGHSKRTYLKQTADGKHCDAAKNLMSAKKAKAYVIYEGQEMTIRQLAQRLGVTRWAIRHMVKRGDIQQIIKGDL